MAGEGTLFVVATPIGNLDDLSPRAARVLRQATVIFAEDTRHSRKLTAHLGLQGRLKSLHRHNERKRTDEVRDRLAAGERLVLVTDAGTPAVSDPGATVIRAAIEAGFGVVPVAGPSALTAALSVAGFATDPPNILFVGFLPGVQGRHRQWLDQVVAHPGLVVFFEAPHRIAATMRALAVQCPERPVCVCRELTKLHEEVLHGTAREMAEWSTGAVKGELTIVLGPWAMNVDANGAVADEAVVAAVERCAQAGMSARDASVAVSTILQVSRRKAYETYQRLRAARRH